MIKIKKIIIVDISNIAHDNCRGAKPKLKNIDLLISTIPDEIELIGIADCSLYHQIDERDRYKREYLNTKLILEAPAGTRADEFILQYAHIRGGHIISNDRFKGYDLVSEKWLKTHRISFMIIRDQLILQRPLISVSQDNVENSQEILSEILFNEKEVIH